MRIAHVIVDVPAAGIADHFDYTVPETIGDIGVGACVLVDFGPRPVVGYVVGLADSSPHSRLKPIRDLLDARLFDPSAVAVARWISAEYLCPLSEAVKLFAPPGGTPKAVRVAGPEGATWALRPPSVKAVDDRWVLLREGHDFVPKINASTQRAILDALADGPVRAAELSADLGGIGGALRALETAGAIVIERRRRLRADSVAGRPAPRHTDLTPGQRRALEAITVAGPGTVILLDGVTGSGKTEVYLQAIERVRAAGRSACVLVPEIALTPQTVGRFRTRFGDEVAVLHSRLSAGERFDQWDRVRSGDAHIVVGARSALFAPHQDLGLIVIDEEHEPSYKQGSSPRYHARDVAARLAAETGAVVVLGSASPSMESRHLCDEGRWTRVVLEERVAGRQLPDVHIVDMADEFSSGHRSMFSRKLTEGLQRVAEAGEKAVLFLNRRGFASFLLCRECGHVPQCDACSVSMTYHEVGLRLQCHHCGVTAAIPPVCPRCSSPYLRRFGAGTQRVEAELAALVPEWPIVRMDADTTKGKGAHERLLATFEALPSAVLLGTQMIAKGLDYPEVTLVGVISADVSLNLPDFRSPERTYQLLEQVAGRAGRGDTPGEVVLQTYWPDHPAVVAAAQHDPESFYRQEALARRELGYPPYGRLANVLVWGRDDVEVTAVASDLATQLRRSAPAELRILGESPSPLARAKGVWRHHVLVKAPPGHAIQPTLSQALSAYTRIEGVTVTVDVDPLDLL